MDNILKMVLGCLGVVGLLVMMIPQGNPLEQKPSAVPTAAAPIPAPAATPPTPPPPAPPANGSSGFKIEDHDIANFGQPMVDPTPPGQRQQQQEQNNPQPGPYGQPVTGPAPQGPAGVNPGTPQSPPET
jgi:hypothetical protein